LPCEGEQHKRALWAEYEAFTKRDLSGFDVVYLFADAVYESLKQQANCRQAVLVSWGILRDGSKVLLYMSLGNRESGDSWLSTSARWSAAECPRR